MKIWYVTNSRFPSERAHMTHIVHMCNAFARHGHAVTLVVTDRRTPIQESPDTFFGVPLQFSVMRIPVPDIAGRARYIPGVLHAVAYSMQRLAFALRLILCIKSERPDVVYGRDEWILWFVGLITRVRTIWESHEAKFPFFARRLIERTKKCVVLSEGVRDAYRSFGVPETYLLVAHDAVDDRFFEQHITMAEARSNLGFSSTLPVVMYVGEFDAWKGITTFFEASHGQDIFSGVVIGGKPEEIERYQKMYPEVIFLGRRPYRELPRHLQAADVLVIPNTAKNETSASYTSPLKLFAYMTAKKPIVASRIQSITNVLNHDEAYFFSADDPKDLQRVIQAVLSDADTAMEKAQRAYQKSHTYTWNNRAHSILTFLGA